MSACGTEKGWKGHKSRNEPPCIFCKRAVTAPTPTPGVKVKPKRTATQRKSRARPDRERKKREHEPIPCGSYAAAGRHTRAGEPLDEACKQARRAYDSANKQAKRGPRKPLVPCGTPGALNRHQRANERCQVCTDADNQRARERRARKKAATQ